jgi:hypothetical protein
MEGRLMFKLFSSPDAETSVPLYVTGFNLRKIFQPLV